MQLKLYFYTYIRLKQNSKLREAESKCQQKIDQMTQIFPWADLFINPTWHKIFFGRLDMGGGTRNPYKYQINLT